jgi:hypothetical protein
MGKPVRLGLNWRDASEQARLAGLFISVPMYQKLKHVENYLLDKEEGGTSGNQ